MSRRYVQQSSNGGWVVVKEGHRRPTAEGSTKAQAVSRARALARRDGGGEVRVVNRAGKVIASNTVPSRDPGRGQSATED